MRGIAGQQDAAVTEAFRHLLVHVIDRAVGDRVGLCARYDALQNPLQ